MNRKINPSNSVELLNPQNDREPVEVYPLILFFYLLIVFVKQPFEVLALMKLLTVKLKDCLYLFSGFSHGMGAHVLFIFYFTQLISSD